MDPQSTTNATTTTTTTTTATAIVNPHNPEFITKKPWYLGDSTDGPTLEHQSVQSTLYKKTPVSLAASEALVQQQRLAAAKLLHQQDNHQKFTKGQWVEALKKNKLPYVICQIIAMNRNQTEFDLQYEDGTVERRVKLFANGSQQHRSRPRIRCTKRGTRTVNVEQVTGMMETYDSKRDAYHGYDPTNHNVTLTARFEERDRIRRKFRQELKQQHQQQPQQDKDTATTTTDSSAQPSGPQESDSNDGGERGRDNPKARDEGGGGSGPAMVVGDSDGDNNNSKEDDDDDEYLQRDEDDRVITTRLARQGGVGGAQMKVTARNLRIREDTAKYLRNLDPNSAYYDPKSRSMRDNPNPEMASEESEFAGDNFTRISADAVQWAETQLFAWEAAEQGVEQVHPQANPSQVEFLKKQYETKAADLKMVKKQAVLERYGGAEHLDGTAGLASVTTATTETKNNTNPPSRKIRFGASVETYSHHPGGGGGGGPNNDVSGDGTGGSGGSRHRVEPIPCKYPENVFVNGHYSVWGSFFHKGAFSWGYADDHSLIKLSYCTGDTGRVANDEAHALQYGTGQAGSAELAQARKMLQAASTSSKNKNSNSSTLAMLQRSQLFGEADFQQQQQANLDQEKVREALERAKERKHEHNDNDSDYNKKKKRKYNSGQGAAQEAETMTAEAMEAYRLSKERRSEDPMANLVATTTTEGGEDVLLEYQS